MNNHCQGKLIILSGPSGVGKSSVVASLLSRCSLPLETSISATTREARPAEVNGVDYHFLTQEEFAKRSVNNEFIETVEVFEQGYWYGTIREPVTQALEKGRWVILEIDVTGALEVLKEYPDAITVFVHPGSDKELEARLRGRKTETEDSIRKRLSFAHAEMELSSSYKHIVVNVEIDSTADEICDLLSKYKEHSCTTN